jgi:uncharacterized damage-inducible protein DinB
MATQKVQLLSLKVPKGYRNTSAAEYLAQLDDLTRRMFEDLKGAKKDELAWQSEPGHNTIGMLITHLAIVEVWWTLVAQKRGTREAIEAVLGFDGDHDGLPLKPGAKAPKALAKLTLKDFEKMMKVARAFVTKHAKTLRDGEMDTYIERTRWDGKKQKVTPRWILYHVVEHFSGHYGQILLLRHQYKDERKKR